MSAKLQTGDYTIRLMVVEGPDFGLQARFDVGETITIGRDTRNNFVLNDGFVSGWHGEIVVERGELVYRDLDSRHGTEIRMGLRSAVLRGEGGPRSVPLPDEAQLRMGTTVIEFTCREDVGAERGSGAAGEGESLESLVSRSLDGRETVVTTALSSVDAITGRFEQADHRLKTLFELSGQLNGLTSLEEVMDRLVGAVFEAFPAANFFAITLVDEGGKIRDAEPFLTQARGELPGDQREGEPILSKSIVAQVIEARESILFLKDTLGEDISQSIIDAQITACLCAPLIGQRSLLGVMQVDTRGLGSLFSREDLDLFSVFASNAAFALERARLSDSIVEMFDSFVYASVNAIEARDPTTAGHSERVATYTLRLADAVNEVDEGQLGEVRFNPESLRELRYAALLHDFGKIAVRESVLQKGKRLPNVKLELIRQRFKTIEALQYQRMIRKRFGQAKGAVSRDVFEVVEEHFEGFRERLAETLCFLMEVSEAPVLADSQIEQVRRLGDQFYIDATGERRTYLTPYEVQNLTIRRGTLSEDEWVNMRSHARRSEDYLERIAWSDELAKIPCIAGAHHEKLDGSGYPAGLRAEEIVPQVRILTIADIFDAVTASDRPYRKAASPKRAVEILREEAGQGKLDADLVELFAGRVLPSILGVVPGYKG